MKLCCIIFLFVLKGFFGNSFNEDCKNWSFTFDTSITALNGSCVEIPCTFSFPEGYREFNLIWYLYHFINYPQVFNKKQPSAVRADYTKLTSLVGNKTNSCTLRISQVENEGLFYPGINEDINSWHCNQKKTALVKIKDTPDEPLLSVPPNLTEGIPAPIFCTVEYTCPSYSPFLQWNKIGLKNVRHEDHEGYWKVISELLFEPTYIDDETQIKCTATYPNSQNTQKIYNLSIKCK
ncbi:myelin-associated glycoprotein-like [Bombina bombina]|uniref:myelin-associated glycoprotein-like n=1 Tax=Bombina bombina TaxID=8345 RepID=UPI00235B0E78|nr:myelin-associated glycoprotein-like [Bombina bombina]